MAERSALKSRGRVGSQSGSDDSAHIRPQSRPSAVKKEFKSKFPKNHASALAKEEIPPGAEVSVLRESPVEEKKSKVRKSNCVKEVEKLQKKREERRCKYTCMKTSCLLNWIFLLYIRTYM